MLDQFKMMGAVAGLMKDKDRLRRLAEEFKHDLERISVIGSAGGGAVRVTVNGHLRVTEVILDPALVASLMTPEGGREMAQSLIEDATNDAIDQARQLVQAQAQKKAAELGLPELPGITALLN